MNKDEIAVQPNYFIAIRVPQQIQSIHYELKESENENEAFQFKHWLYEKIILDRTSYNWQINEFILYKGTLSFGDKR